VATEAVAARASKDAKDEDAGEDGQEGHGHGRPGTRRHVTGDPALFQEGVFPRVWVERVRRVQTPHGAERESDDGGREGDANLLALALVEAAAFCLLRGGAGAEAEEEEHRETHGAANGGTSLDSSPVVELFAWGVVFVAGAVKVGAISTH